MIRINALLLVLLSVCTLNAYAQEKEANPLDAGLFAMVNGEAISVENYLMELSRGMRQRFYHGSVPEEQLRLFRREIADQLIADTLLLQEARRRDIQPDSKAIEQQLAQYEKRYANSAQWQSRREKLLPGLRRELENKSLLERVTTSLKVVETPSDAAVREYYKQNPEKFTSPERRKVSLILLKVDPSSPSTVWASARTEAGQLIARIKGGEDFAELAKVHSADTLSAATGGDMGYLHKGMLAESVEQVLDKLSEGELSEPITTLQGIVIVRLDDTIKAKLNSFDKVKSRAADLLMRDLSEQQYERSIEQLREHAELKVNEGLISQTQ